MFGATVELEEEDTGEKVKYQIVGEDEADLKQGLINISSPIARALIGKEEGDTAEVQAPGGIKRYEIVAVALPLIAGLRRRACPLLAAALWWGSLTRHRLPGRAAAVRQPAHAGAWPAAWRRSCSPRRPGWPRLRHGAADAVARDEDEAAAHATGPAARSAYRAGRDAAGAAAEFAVAPRIVARREPGAVARRRQRRCTCCSGLCALVVLLEG